MSTPPSNAVQFPEAVLAALALSAHGGIALAAGGALVLVAGGTLGFAEKQSMLHIPALSLMRSSMLGKWLPRSEIRFVF